MIKPIQIGLVGDYRPEVVAHQAIPQALAYAAEQTQTTVEATWIHTSTIPSDVGEFLAPYHAIWCIPASPYENMAGALAAIRFAREQHRPFLGT